MTKKPVMWGAVAKLVPGKWVTFICIWYLCELIMHAFLLYMLLDQCSFFRLYLWDLCRLKFDSRNDERCREKWVNSLDPTLISGSFTPKEYELLRKLIEKKGIGNWAEKSLWFPGRTDANLMSRWKTHCMTGKLSAYLRSALISSD